MNGISDKKSDILISLILGLLPAYLFHLVYTPKYVLIENNSLSKIDSIVYKECKHENCSCFKLEKNKQCKNNYDF
tara:strand:+ start:118 stop:342 length:225 start_codon:yes stop_codon:yes gene_type:complete